MGLMKDRFFEEMAEEGIEVSSYEEKERKRLMAQIDALKPPESLDLREWARGALAQYRKRNPSAELCLAGDEWRIEVSRRSLSEGKAAPFLGVPVWRV